MESKVEKIKDILTDYPPTLDLEEWKDKVAIMISSLCQSEPPEQRYDPAIVRIPITSKPEQVICPKPDNCWGCKFADIPNRLCTLLKEVKNEIGIIHTNDVPKWCPVPSTPASDCYFPCRDYCIADKGYNPETCPIREHTPDSEEMLLTDEELHEACGFGVSSQHHRLIAKAQLAKATPLIEERTRKQVMNELWQEMSKSTNSSVLAYRKVVTAKVEAPLRAEIEMLNLALMNRKSEVIRLKDSIIRNQ